MLINEIKLPSDAAVNESVQRGQITEAVGAIIKTHTANQWSQPMTAEEAAEADLRIIAEAVDK
jgi:hypothetical protein